MPHAAFVKVGDSANAQDRLAREHQPRAVSDCHFWRRTKAPTGSGRIRANALGWRLSTSRKTPNPMTSRLAAICIWCCHSTSATNAAKGRRTRSIARRWPAISGQRAAIKAREPHFSIQSSRYGERPPHSRIYSVVEAALPDDSLSAQEPGACPIGSAQIQTEG